MEVLLRGLLITILSQGNRILITGSEHLEEIVIFPSGLELLSMDTAFSSFLLFEQIDGDMAKNSDIFRGLILADSTVVFVQGDI